MKTKEIILLITVVIIGLFIFQSHKNDERIMNSHNRTFNDSIILVKSSDPYENLNSDFNLYIPSKNNLVFSKRDSYDMAISNIVFMDPKTLELINEVELDLATNSRIIYADSSTIFLREGFDLFALALKTMEKKKISFEGLKITKLVKMNENTGLVLGGVYKDSIHQFGYYKLDFKNNKITETVKILSKSSQDEFVENSLKYAGRFHFDQNKYIYVFDKYGKILLFDEDGSFFNQITTVDKVELPQVTFFNGMYTYKRGSTYNANAAAFIQANSLYSFSCRPSNVDFIIIDRYNINDGQYISSYKLELDSMISSDINYLSKNSNLITLGFNKSIQNLNLK